MKTTNAAAAAAGGGNDDDTGSDTGVGPKIAQVGMSQKPVVCQIN